jgi:hypothetical protein
MKTFWNLMLAISVLLGVVACTNDSSNISDDTNEGFSFIASIDHTRADVINNDGTWQTVWSGDDKLLVTSDSGNFVFTNSKEEPARFVSNDAEASTLRNATNIVITTSLVSIGDDAFFNCPALTRIDYNGTKTPFANISIGLWNENFKNAEVVYSGYSWYVRGTFNSWTGSIDYGFEKYDATQQVIVVTLNQGGEFKVVNSINSWSATNYGFDNVETGCRSNFTKGENGNIVVSVSGTYKIYLKPNTNSMWIEKM